MVHLEMEKRLISLSNCQNRHLLRWQLAGLLMCLLPGLARRGQLAATLDHDLMIVPCRPGSRRDIVDTAVQANCFPKTNRRPRYLV